MPSAARLREDYSAEDLRALARRSKDWRRVGLKRVIADKFGVDFHERYLGKLLKKLGFSHISARPRHSGQDARMIEAF